MTQAPNRLGRFLRCSCLAAGAALFCHWQNSDIVSTKLSYRSPKIPKGFDGYKIVHVSDLHNKQFGPGQSRLIEKIKAENADVIVITGDLIDCRRTDVRIAMNFIRGVVPLAPVCYVPGNHEAESGIYPALASKMAALGVLVLNDKAIKLQKNGDEIELLGMCDPTFQCGDNNAHACHLFGEALSDLSKNKQDCFTILLSHRPELLPLYAECGINLVFSGHAHGGQFRLPFAGAVFAPNQGFFPEYTSGICRQHGTAMVVSRGLGNSLIPQRIFNRPEIITVTLNAIEKKVNN